jgi:peptidoglycan/xylan/chitin deacetylase (PgdA/CDA1 family)
MRIVSPFLKKVIYPSLSTASVFRRTAPPGLAVVTYHGVLPRGYEPVDAAFDGNLISADTLFRQLRLLKAHYSVIAPEDVLAWRKGRSELPPRAVLLTCDDGLLNNLTEMLPVLRHEEVKCLFFVTGASAADTETRSMLWYEELFLLYLRARAGHFEISHEGASLSGNLQSWKQRRTVWWNSVQRLSQLGQEKRTSFLRALQARFGLDSWRAFDPADSVSCSRFGLLTSSELRELAAAGMTIGAHTLSHPILSQCPPDLAHYEIAECRVQLEAVLQQPVWAFAYPFGDEQSVSPQVLTAPEQAGYSVAFLNFGGGLGGGELPPFAIPRVHVTAEMSLAELEAHVSGFHAWLQRRAGRSPQVLAG